MMDLATTALPASLARSLEPVLQRQCLNQLDPIRWFRTDWQRGGAATGYSTWTHEDGSSDEVVVKFPVVLRELRWTRRMQDCGGVVPKLFASGIGLGGYDLAWLVIERLPFGPLGKHWDDSIITRISSAAAAFTSAAREFPVDVNGRLEDWDELIKRSKKSIKVNSIKSSSKWKKMHKWLGRNLEDILDVWRARHTRQWLHGDIHLANSMCRSEKDDAPVCLIDLAEVHAGHWVEDAIYLERQLWGHPSRLASSKPLKSMAYARNAIGLKVAEDYIELANIRRLLLAATAPAFMQSEGDPRYLGACLDQFQKMREVITL
ncbi:MAG: phosphotransferase [Phycisphaerales bacterium]|nr:phosphotransferase [Phycisphaerales bacterium]